MCYSIAVHGVFHRHPNFKLYTRTCDGRVRIVRMVYRVSIHGVRAVTRVTRLYNGVLHYPLQCDGSERVIRGSNAEAVVLRVLMRGGPQLG